jgi:hypothetical protein
MALSVHPTLCFLFLSLLGFDSRKIDYLLNFACGIFASLGPRNVYKDMLNNMVSHIDHVVLEGAGVGRHERPPSSWCGLVGEAATVRELARADRRREWMWQAGRGEVAWSSYPSQCSRRELQSSPSRRLVGSSNPPQAGINTEHRRIRGLGANGGERRMVSRVGCAGEGVTELGLVVETATEWIRVCLALAVEIREGGALKKKDKMRRKN